MTMLFVHHMRKMHDPDPMNTISGSMGLVGAKDGAFVLEGKRAPAIARPTSPNRDADGFCFELYFDTKGSKIGKRDGVTVAMPTPLLLLYRRAEEESASANFFAGGDYNSRRTDAADVFS